MHQNMIDTENEELLQKLTCLVGNKEKIVNISSVSPREPFDCEVIEFLNSVSKRLMNDSQSRLYSDVVTFAFWIRKSSMVSLKEKYLQGTDGYRIGRGVAFHIAPSNVAVNYAYSLVSGLISGNANIVRIPSKEFQQVSIINKAIRETLIDYPVIEDYITLIKYERDERINDLLSSIADTRIVWGGDRTIEEIRKSPLGPRSGEITFADRYSIAIIDSDIYLASESKEKIAEGFYNDTFLTDQNACTSPKVVVWTGNSIEKAKQIFWTLEHNLVKKKYIFQPIMGINKLTSAYLIAATNTGIGIESMEDNLIVRVRVSRLEPELMKLKDNSGYFFEYDCTDILELRDICNNTHCQTISYLGNKETIRPLLVSGIKGVDRVVPIGKTMDFDLIWDGYNLLERMTRTISIV